MIEQRRSMAADEDAEAEMSAADIAAYIADLCGEMSKLAHRVGLSRTALVLDMAKFHAKEEAAESTSSD